MKRYSLLIALLGCSVAGFSQLNIQSGATFFIQSGATVTVQGDVTSNADIQGPGLLQLKGSALQTVNMNGFTVQNVQVDNSNNISLAGAAGIGTNLTFTTGRVLLNGFDLNLASAATLTGFDNSKYFVTNSTGRLVKNSLSTAFTFPVGFDASSYNPLSITQGGTVDNIGVRVLPSVLQNGTSGNAFVKEVVDASWAVTEAVAGGSNLTITSTWAGTDELPGFNRAKTGISYYDGVGWDMLNTQTLAATGSGPYTVTRNSVTNLANGGIFAVGTRPVLTVLQAAPRIFLQGAYINTPTAGLMRDDLRAAGVIPTSSPYDTIAIFSSLGSGGGESVPSSVFAGTATGNDIVDWVWAQLHNTDGSVRATRAVFVERDGDVVDFDGTNTKTSFINFAGEVAGNYYVSIRHRNHVGVRTPSLLALSRTSFTVYDFTTSAAQALNSIQASLGGGRFALYGADGQANGSTRYTGPSAINDNFYLLTTTLGGNRTNTSLNGVYRRGDYNMNGSVRYTGPSAINDNFFLLTNVLGGNRTNTSITQPF